MNKKKKLQSKDKKLIQWLKAGGREGVKQDMMGLIITSAKLSKKSR